MTDRMLAVYNLFFSYDTASFPVFEDINCHIHSGWTGVAGPNGCGKTTFLKLMTGKLVPESGYIDIPSPVYYLEQRTDTMPGDFGALIASRDKQSFRIMNTLGIQDGWIDRWDTLSHGERKRIQIGTALFMNPAVLAIDEPSNHLDNETRDTLLDALRSYKGIGILVSHDRHLLDTLCSHTLFIDPPVIDIRKGGYSTAAGERGREQEHVLAQDIKLKKQMKKMGRELARRQRLADSADTKKSKKSLGRNDRDGRAKLDLARLSGKDAVAGKLYSRMKSRTDRLAEERSDLNIMKSAPSGIAFEEQKVSGVYPLILAASTISLGGGKELAFPDIVIDESDRIGLIGANGTGKSTFVRYLAGKIGLSGRDMLSIPQEITAEESGGLLAGIRELDSEKLGLLMAFVSRLGSDPDRLLETATPTPGETRKLMLAEGITHNPALIIMDEPTNHMDLPSVEYLEEALASVTCPILLVSHDRRFLKNMVKSALRFIRKSETGYAIEYSHEIDM